MVHKVDTGASILARLILALIHFVLAVDALISWDTLIGQGKKDNKCWTTAGNSMGANEIWNINVTLHAPPSSCTPLQHHHTY